MKCKRVSLTDLLDYFSDISYVAGFVSADIRKCEIVKAYLYYMPFDSSEYMQIGKAEFLPMID